MRHGYFLIRQNKERAKELGYTILFKTNEHHERFSVMFDEIVQGTNSDQFSKFLSKYGFIITEGKENIYIKPVENSIGNILLSFETIDWISIAKDLAEKKRDLYNKYHYMFKDQSCLIVSYRDSSSSYGKNYWSQQMIGSGVWGPKKY